MQKLNPLVKLNELKLKGSNNNKKWGDKTFLFD